MHRFRHLMVGLSRSRPHRGLIRYAAMLARMGAVVEVQFLHVLPAPGTAGSAPFDRDRILVEVESEVAAHFNHVPPDVRVGASVAKGASPQAIVQFAHEQETDLILIGHRRNDPDEHRLARRLARTAPCSVWMVPHDAPADIRRILVPVDFSPDAADALNVAASIARARPGCNCRALHVELRPIKIDYTEAGPTVFLREFDPERRQRDELAFQRFVEPLQTEGVDVAPLFEVGSSIERIVNRTAIELHADLLVMTSRGRTPWAALLDPCATEETIRESQRPLLVLKHFGGKMSLFRALLNRLLGR